MSKIEAKIIADSKDNRGNRITTMILTFPRFILAEFNTHRMFSRNSASSRAIPFNKIVEKVENDPFIPIAWQKEHKGMQGNKYFTKQNDINRNITKWLTARDNAIGSSKHLNAGFPEDEIGIGVTKQLCNRLLEPFMWHTCLVTATEWENFFKLRCPQYEVDTELFSKQAFRSKRDVMNAIYEGDIQEYEKFSITDWLNINKGAAEIHMMALAEAMWDAYNESEPISLIDGQWHIPFHKDMPFKVSREDQTKIATARCARVSYTTQHGDHSYTKDIELHDRLLNSGHMSPFEHCAKAMNWHEYSTFSKGQFSFSKKDDSIILVAPQMDLRGWCNNFRGFIQYRHIVENNK